MAWSSLVFLLLGIPATWAASTPLPGDRADAPPPEAAPPREGPARVLVSEFQPADEASAGYAALLRDFLGMELGFHPDLEVVPVEEAPPFGETSALVYLQSCPPGEYVGCAFVVGQAAGADYAVTGLVQAHETGGARVDLTVVDVRQARTAVSFRIEVGVGEDERFAAGVARIVAAVAAGLQGRLEDIREQPEPDQQEDPRRRAEELEQVARELEELQAELGEVEPIAPRDVAPPRYTVGDLLDDMQTDATAPWEELGMSMRDYLLFRNSGMSLETWQRLLLGRRGKVFVRAGGGLLRGPVDTLYNGQYALDPTGVEWVVVQRYAWQTVQTGSGFGGGAWVGYGLLPWLSVEGGVGATEGTFTYSVTQEVVGRSPQSPVVLEVSQFLLWVGGRVLLVPMPYRRARPTLALGGTWRRGFPQPINWEQQEVPELPPPSFFEVVAAPGAEVGLGDRATGMVLVPIGILVGGSPDSSYQEGQNVIGEPLEMPPASAFSAGLELSIAVDFLGAARRDAR